MALDWRFFVNANDTSKEAPEIAKPPWFWTDVRARLSVDYKIYERKVATVEKSKVEPKTLQLLVNNIVRTYVLQRTASRTGIELPTKADSE